MPLHIPIGIEKKAARPGRVSASTFMELVVTMFLLVLFASIAFPILWSTTKATAAHALGNVAQQSRLSLVSMLPRFTEEVLPPYWENPGKVFACEGSEYKIAYLDGDRDGFLVLRKEGESRLSIATPKTILFIGNLPELALDWWKKDGRTIGITVKWRQGTDAMEFHSSWGSFTL
jgi:hypothetical protein